MRYLTRNLLAGFLLLLSVTSACADVPNAAALEKIDRTFSKWTPQTPGCALGISHNGVVTTRAWGMADLERSVPNQPGGVFESGSVAKQVTAAAVLLLVQDGKLSLDDPVRKFITELPEYDAPLTIRHALQHTGGLREWGDLVNLEGWPRGQRNVTNAYVVALLSRQRALNFTPGTHWSYSNSGYVLAAEIVARVSGKSLAEFSMERLFKPLNLPNTRWRDDPHTLVPQRALAYASTRTGYRTDMPNESVYGAGGLLTTVADMLTWTEAINRPGFFDAAFLKLMHQPAKLASGQDYPYSLGLQHRVWRGLNEVYHAGATAGYRTFVAAFPERNLNLAVLCNAASAAPGNLLHDVAAVLLGDTLPPDAPNPPSHSQAAVERDAFLGWYRDPRGFAVRRIVPDDKSPAGLRIDDGPRLSALTATRLTTSEGVRIDLTESGITVTNNSGPVQHWQRVTPVAPALATFKDFEGRYTSTEAHTEFQIKIVGDKLMILRSPLSNLPLKPIADDLFNSTLGGISFTRNAAGKVIGLAIGSDRMWRFEMARVE